MEPISTDQPDQSEPNGRLSRLRARALARRGAGATRRLANVLPNGLSGPFLAAIAACVLIAILYTVASRDSNEPRGFAELTLSANACEVDPRQSSNAALCSFRSPGVYAVTFSKSLGGSAVLATRGSCCPGRISASIESDKVVVLAVEPRIPRVIRVAIFVP